MEAEKLKNVLKVIPQKNKDGVLFFLNSVEEQEVEKELSQDINILKTFLKKWPAFYNFLQALITPAFSPINYFSVHRALIYAGGEDKIILNLGSGTKRVSLNAINVDFYPFKNVDVVADVRELPFKDGSADLVIVDSVLEHVPKVEAAIKEIKRVVKPSGYIYITVPFMYPFHASPNDYKRWTLEGLKNDFDGFDEVYSGMRGGPMGVLQGALMHIFALLLSFGSEKLYLFWSQFFMAILWPIKIFDIVFLIFPNSEEVASHIYFFGKKN